MSWTRVLTESIRALGGVNYGKALENDNASLDPIASILNFALIGAAQIQDVKLQKDANRFTVGSPTSSAQKILSVLNAKSLHTSITKICQAAERWWCGDSRQQLSYFDGVITLIAKTYPLDSSDQEQNQVMRELWGYIKVGIDQVAQAYKGKEDTPFKRWSKNIEEILGVKPVVPVKSAEIPLKVEENSADVEGEEDLTSEESERRSDPSASTAPQPKPKPKVEKKKVKKEKETPTNDAQSLIVKSPINDPNSQHTSLLTQAVVGQRKGAASENSPPPLKSKSVIEEDDDGFEVVNIHRSGQVSTLPSKELIARLEIDQKVQQALAEFKKQLLALKESVAENPNHQVIDDLAFVIDQTCKENQVPPRLIGLAYRIKTLWPTKELNQILIKLDTIKNAKDEETKSASLTLLEKELAARAEAYSQRVEQDSIDVKYS